MKFEDKLKLMIADGKSGESIVTFVNEHYDEVIERKGAAKANTAVEEYKKTLPTEEVIFAKKLKEYGWESVEALNEFKTNAETINNKYGEYVDRDKKTAFDNALTSVLNDFKIDGSHKEIISKLVDRSSVYGDEGLLPDKLKEAVKLTVETDLKSIIPTFGVEVNLGDPGHDPKPDDTVVKDDIENFRKRMLGNKK